MYRLFKRLLKILIPKGLLFRIEPFLRSIFYQFYRGNKYQCNICKKKLRRFIDSKDNDYLCPNCGSLSRNRRLWSIMEQGYIEQGNQVLDFSPSRCLYRNLKKSPINYICSDLSGDFLADFHYDITHIESSDESYDVIICYHILEHIENDIQAMKELFRVLKPGGTCIIQTPFKSGEIYENYELKTEKEREKHFGQKDHVRIYSISGLEHRLSKQGFHVSIKEYAELKENYNGLKESECVLFCRK